MNVINNNDKSTRVRRDARDDLPDIAKRKEEKKPRGEGGGKFLSSLKCAREKHDEWD